MGFLDEVMDFSDGILGGIQDSIANKYLGTGGEPGSEKRRSVRQAFAPRRVVYGTHLVKPTLVYADSIGNESSRLWLVFVVASQYSSEFKEIRFGDEVVLSSDGPLSDNYHLMSVVNVDHGDTYKPFVRLGQPGQSFDLEIYGPWSDRSQHLFGQTAFAIRLDYDTEIFSEGIPDITVLLEGKRLYDPRTLLTEYSQNFSLTVLDWLIEIIGVPISGIDIQNFIDAANICDGQVPSVDAQTEDRFSVSGIMELDKTPLQNMETILSSAAASLIRVQGKWKLILPVYSVPVLSLNESDLASNISFQTRSGKSERVNVMRGSYISPDHEWERVDSPVLSVSEYIENDGERLEQTIDYDLLSSGYQVQRLNKIHMERSRFGIVLTARFKWKALRLIVGDRVTFSCADLGWVDKVFQVVAMVPNYETGVLLTLREDSSTIYDWSVGEALPVSKPAAMNLPDHSLIDHPASLTVEEELYQTANATDIKVRAKLSWPELAGTGYRYDLQYKEWLETDFRPLVWRSSGDVFFFDDIAPGRYDFRVRAINDVGFKSNWLSVFYEVLGKTLPPPDIESLFVDAGVLIWTYPSAPIDLAGFEVRVHDGDRQTWADATKLHVGLISSSRFTLPSSSGGTKTFLVKAIDTSGNASENAAVAVVGLGDPNVQNVILIDDYKTNNWPGVLIDCSVNGSNELVADQVGGFFNPDPNSIFYNQAGASSFYDTEFKKLVYEFDYTVLTQDIGSQLTVDAVVSADSFQIEFIPPSGGATYSSFSGYVPAVEGGVYKFRLSVPAQFGAVAPKVTGLTVSLDVPDITESLENIAISNGGTRLPISKTYRGISFVNLTMQTDGSGVASLKVDDKNHTLGPLIYAYNAAGTAVSTTIDAFIRGY